MWTKIAKLIIKHKYLFLIGIFVFTIFLGFQAFKVELSYAFNNNIPTDNPEYINLQSFQKVFGNDGDVIILGVQTPDFFDLKFAKSYQLLENDLSKMTGVNNVLGVFNTFDIKAQGNEENKTLSTFKIFDSSLSVENLLSSRSILEKNQFYKNLLFNLDSHTFFTVLNLKNEYVNSKKREAFFKTIDTRIQVFEKETGIHVYKSGLPYIRTKMAWKVQYEMKIFLLGSLIITSLIILFFFRSFFLLFTTLIYVGIGIVWGMGLVHLFGFKITLLTALLPPLVVIIAVPNAIYFINKFHNAILDNMNLSDSVLFMVERIGIVTLFTNLTTAVGFGVFSITQSKLLHEFGIVAGISVMLLFILALILIPIFTSFSTPPKPKHLKYLHQSWNEKLFKIINYLIVFKRQYVYIIISIVFGLAIFGMFQLKANSFIVDDIPKEDIISQDLAFFEKHLNGVMPLEIIIKSNKKNDATSLGTLTKMEELNEVIKSEPSLGRSLSIAEGIKFARQAYYDGEPSGYGLPNSFDVAFFAPYLQGKMDSKSKTNQLLSRFVDSTKQIARLSLRMKDIGTDSMDALLNRLKIASQDIFDSNRHKVTITGTSVTFLEGSKYIIGSLKDSLIFAIIVIFACILYLFRNWRILLMAIVVNIIPLIITAGIMGYFGIRLKPSTVLIFSVVLGITVDVTIRFLVNYKQELELNPNLNLKTAIKTTVEDTGVSIILTTLILIFGFGVFALSDFQGTKALGILIPLTLFNAMVVNLTLLPTMLMWMRKTLLKKKWLSEVKNLSNE